MKWRSVLRGSAWVLAPSAVFAITRLGVFLVAYAAVALLPESDQPPLYHLRGTDNLLLDVFGSRWDTGFYVSIAQEGYKLEGVELPSVAFFPLLPMLMRMLGPLVGDVLVAGLVISNSSLLIATILFYRLVADELGEKVADRSVWYLCIFPASFFGSAIYTESLFLLTSIAALYLARRGRWLPGGLMGFAAALTRVHGILVGVLLLFEWWRQWRLSRSGEASGAEVAGYPAPPLAGLLAGLLAPLGTLTYMAYCWQAFGNPLAFVKAASAWGRQAQSPYLTIGQLLRSGPGDGWAALARGSFHMNNWIDLSLVLLFLVLGCQLLSLRKWGEGLFVVMGVTLSFSTGLLMSQRRYVWVLFPVFALLASWGERPWVDRLVTVASLCGLALFTALFANGYWVG